MQEVQDRTGGSSAPCLPYLPLPLPSPAAAPCGGWLDPEDQALAEAASDSDGEERGGPSGLAGRHGATDSATYTLAASVHRCAVSPLRAAPASRRRVRMAPRPIKGLGPPSAIAAAVALAGSSHLRPAVECAAERCWPSVRRKRALALMGEPAAAGGGVRREGDCSSSRSSSAGGSPAGTQAGGGAAAPAPDAPRSSASGESTCTALGGEQLSSGRAGSNSNCSIVLRSVLLAVGWRARRLSTGGLSTEPPAKRWCEDGAGAASGIPCSLAPPQPARQDGSPARGPAEEPLTGEQQHPHRLANVFPSSLPPQRCCAGRGQGWSSPQVPVPVPVSPAAAQLSPRTPPAGAPQQPPHPHQEAASSSAQPQSEAQGAAASAPASCTASPPASWPSSSCRADPPSRPLGAGTPQRPCASASVSPQPTSPQPTSPQPATRLCRCPSCSGGGGSLIPGGSDGGAGSGAGATAGGSSTCGQLRLTAYRAAQRPPAPPAPDCARQIVPGPSASTPVSAREPPPFALSPHVALAVIQQPARPGRQLQQQQPLPAPYAPPQSPQQPCQLRSPHSSRMAGSQPATCATLPYPEAPPAPPPPGCSYACPCRVAQQLPGWGGGPGSGLRPPPPHPSAHVGSTAKGALTAAASAPALASAAAGAQCAGGCRACSAPTACRPMPGCQPWAAAGARTAPQSVPETAPPPPPLQCSQAWPPQPCWAQKGAASVPQQGQLGLSPRPQKSVGVPPCCYSSTPLRGVATAAAVAGMAPGLAAAIGGQAHAIASTAMVFAPGSIPPRIPPPPHLQTPAPPTTPLRILQASQPGGASSCLPACTATAAAAPAPSCGPAMSGAFPVAAAPRVAARGYAGPAQRPAQGAAGPGHQPQWASPSGIAGPGPGLAPVAAGPPPRPAAPGTRHMDTTPGAVRTLVRPASAPSATAAGAAPPRLPAPARPASSPSVLAAHSTGPATPPPLPLRASLLPGARPRSAPSGPLSWTCRACPCPQCQAAVRMPLAPPSSAVLPGGPAAAQPVAAQV